MGTKRTLGWLRPARAVVPGFALLLLLVLALKGQAVGGESVLSPQLAHAQSPVLAISKSASPDPVVAGGELTYVITITNTGDAPLQGLVVSDEVPERTTFSLMGSRSGQWLMSGPNRGTRGPVTWKSAVPLAPGQAVQVQLVVWVDSADQNPVTNAEYGVSADGEKVRGEPVTTHVMLPTPTPTPTVTPTSPAPTPTVTSMSPIPTRVSTPTPVPQLAAPTPISPPTLMPTPVPGPGSPVRQMGLFFGVVSTVAVLVPVAAWFVKSKDRR
jgi:uncharacterized repeat protein (TIGR01451 family)